jgi:thioredoxin 1
MLCSSTIKAKRTLEENHMLKTVTDSSFEADVIKSSRPVLVDFWAAWCQPCLAMEPALKELAKEFEGKIDVAKLNVDENPHASQSFDVMSIPNMVIFKDGKPVDRIIGLTSKDKVASALNAAIK